MPYKSIHASADSTHYSQNPEFVEVREPRTTDTSSIVNLASSKETQAKALAADTAE